MALYGCQAKSQPWPSGRAHLYINHPEDKQQINTAEIDSLDPIRSLLSGFSWKNVQKTHGVIGTPLQFLLI